MHSCVSTFSVLNVSHILHTFRLILAICLKKTPHVSGALALCASINPTITPRMMRSYLMKSAAPTTSLNGAVVSDGRLDVGAMMEMCHNYVAPAEGLCSADFDCDDGERCTVDTCDVPTGQCVNTMTSGCPMVLSTNVPLNFYITGGVMFDVEAIGDILLTSLAVHLFEAGYSCGRATTTNVDVYTKSGSFAGSTANPAAWTKIVNSQAVSTTTCAAVELSFPDIALDAGNVQAFYVATK